MVSLNIALNSVPLTLIAATEHPGGKARLLRLAHDAVVAEVLRKTPPGVASKTPPRPVFVTIERRGDIRGCRGSLAVRARSLEEEIVLAARAAAGHDPRHRPLRTHELAELRVTVTIVQELRPLVDVATLSPSDGLVLRAGNRTGVVLPWEGRDPRLRLQWAYRKAGVAPGTTSRLFRMVAERFSE